VLLTVEHGDLSDIQLPGGGIDAGEQPLAALHREVLEETGWTIAAPRKLGVFRRFAFMPDYDLWAEKICHIYVARPVRQVAEPSEPHHTAIWMDLLDASSQMGNAGDRYFMKRFFYG
jgi:8-oxo-dGTP diphosphatase